MGPEKLDQDEVPIEAEGIEDFTLAIGGGELRDGIAHLDTPGGIEGLWAYIHSEQKETANQHAQCGREATGNTGALDIREDTHGYCQQPCCHEAGAGFRQTHSASHIEPQPRRTQREGQCSNANFGS